MNRAVNITPLLPAPLERPFLRLGPAWGNPSSTMKALNLGCMIYRTGTDLVEPVVFLNKNQIEVELRKIGERRLLALMGEVADYAKLDRRRKTWTRCRPPLELARAILAMPDRWPFPPVPRHAPVGEDRSNA